MQCRDIHPDCELRLLRVSPVPPSLILLPIHVHLLALVARYLYVDLLPGVARAVPTCFAHQAAQRLVAVPPLLGGYLGKIGGRVGPPTRGPKLDLYSMDAHFPVLPVVARLKIGQESDRDDQAR